MRLVEIAVFLGLSSALHVVALTLAPAVTGSGGGGEDGAHDITLTPATPTLAAMVADWERPPQVSEIATLATPSSDQAPRRPTPDHPVSPAPSHTALPVPLPRPAAPTVETARPAPPAPVAEATPDAPPQPRLPQTRTALSTPETAPARSRVPDQPAAPTPSTLPRVDLAEPLRRAAPTASLRPEARSDAPTISRPAQTARGTGRAPTAAAPAPKAPVASGPTAAQLAQAQAQWGAGIRAAVARAQRYPHGTRAQGVVTLQIAVSPSGRATGVRIVQSSGDRHLDQAALHAVERARLPRAPQGLTAASYRFNLPLSFRR